MKLSRREFLQVTGGTAALGVIGADLPRSDAAIGELRTQGAKVTTSICPFCAVGCGLFVYSKDGRVINIEGDLDHPINEGALCPKGASLYQVVNNDTRLTKPLYRAPGGTEWKEVEWDWALDEIAKRIKKTRDESFVEKNAKGQVVNRCDRIAHVGSSSLDNEECYALQKWLRSLGIVYIEHQARICHSATVAALAESFGRGAMTNHWIDIRNADIILAMGSNPAENHTISFKWVMEAKKKGAKLISVDPRFTRTSSVADIYAPIRSGTDIAFLNGMIKYILDNELYDKYYVSNYTNASFLVEPSFKLPSDLDGLFSGYSSEKRVYNKDSWRFQVDDKGVIKKDESMNDPGCVFQILKKHVSRYTLEMLEGVTGTPKDKLIEIYKTYASSGHPERSATIMYALGWTQHSVGTQNIRAMAMIQLLLGNIGIAGGGVNALRGESNVQGATDHCVLFHILPGYLKTPKASDSTLRDYNIRNTPGTSEPRSANWWANYPKYSVSLLKAFFGDNAYSGNDFGFAWLPKLDDDQNASWLMLFHEMLKGKFKGFFAWGQNPACSGANAGKVRKALTKLDWMVSVNLFDSETSLFWRGPGMKPEEIKTEVFQLPVSSFVEKEGSLTNSGRWVQWRYKAVEPLGQTKSDGWIVHELHRRVKTLYEKEGGTFPDPVVKLHWPYRVTENEIDTITVAKEINGFFTVDKVIDGKTYKKGTQVPGFALLQNDGSTASGNWLYCGSFTEDGNMMTRRKKSDPTGLGMYPEWSWCWPVNRRILYNRASVDDSGVPRNKAKAVIVWNGTEWSGDVPDGGWPPFNNVDKSKLAFIMQPDGVGSLFGPGRVDGPFPEHYEPLESPLNNNPFSKSQRINPAVVLFYERDKLPEDIYAASDARFPIVATTYRVTEHWETGVMSRRMSWLHEMMPQQFVELSRELAKERGIQNGEKVVVSSIRGEIWAIAMVTHRLKPFTIMGKTVHLIGLPFCFGWQYPEDGSAGDSVNLLSPTIGDPNTMIPETKAFMVNLKKA